jgi:hypothetical protein
MNKALELLKTNKTVAERAENYATSMKRNIQRDVIDTLVAKKEKYEDEIFELSNFTLDTNINRGVSQMTKEDCEARFKKLIQIEFELTLLNIELKAKTESFNKYFGETSAVSE